MMTTKAYLMTWGLYLLSAAGLMVLLYGVTRGWRPVAFRLVVRAIVGVWLLAPMMVDPDADRITLAPAFIVLLFESASGFDAATRVLWPMLVLTVLAIPVLLAVHWTWSRWRANRPLLNVPRPMATPRVEPTLSSHGDEASRRAASETSDQP